MTSGFEKEILLARGTTFEILNEQTITNKSEMEKWAEREDVIDLEALVIYRLRVIPDVSDNNS